MYLLTVVTWIITITCIPGKPSGRDFQRTFTANCETLKRRRPQLTSGVPSCSELWGDFSRPFLNQKCDLPENRFNYANYTQKAGHQIPENKLFQNGNENFLFSQAYLNEEFACFYFQFGTVMFWTKVMLNPGNRFLTISDTMLGYPVGSDIWCGQTTPPGYQLMTTRPYTNATLKFWKQASEKLATLVTGRASLMLSGLKKPVFSTDTIFATIELPELHPPRALSLRVFVVSRRGERVTERCGQGSLLELSSRVSRQGLQYSCIDDHDEVQHELCEDKEPCWTFLSPVSGAAKQIVMTTHALAAVVITWLKAGM